jgi:N-acetylmuramoyl-L-alanine amidase
LRGEEKGIALLATMKLLAGSACGLAFFFFPLDVYAITKILDVRHWSAPDHTRIVFDLSGPASYKVYATSDSQTLSWCIENTIFPAKEKIAPINDLVVKSVSLKSFSLHRVRVTVTLVQPVQPKIFTLKKYLDKPDRLVIDLHRSDLEGKERDKRQEAWGLKAKKIRIVVIDPGHGGEDPGAIGLRGTKEKDIVFGLAKKLKKILDQDEGIKAFLTRKGDYFISLAERVRIAREYKADLFISLHCNGHRKRNLRGSSVYCVSLKGSSDIAARLLAEEENASDRIGGIFADAVSTRVLDSILKDLSQTNVINNSLRLGGMALGELEQVNPVQFNTPRQAEFAVLKAPDFPSILVECAYLTNPKEEYLLKNASFQDRLAKALAESVKKFLSTLIIQEKEVSRMVKSHGTSDHRSLR